MHTSTGHDPERQYQKLVLANSRSFTFAVTMPISIVAEFTVAEVAADCVDADCICVAVAIVSGAFVDI